MPYKKFGPYKASYSLLPKEVCVNASAVRPSPSSPVSEISEMPDTANPGSSALPAAVEQGISRRCAPAGGARRVLPENQASRKAQT